MFEPDALILPGTGAGGIRLGARIEDTLRESGISFKAETPVIGGIAMRGTTWHQSPMVILQEEDGRISSITVRDGYRGTLRGGVAIGSTVAEVEARIGPVGENEWDELTIEGVPGVIFEIEGIFQGSLAEHLLAPAFHRARITWIAVFRISDK